MNKKKNDNKKTLIPGLILFLGWIILSNVQDPRNVILAVMCLIVAAFVAATVFAVKKTAAAGQPSPRRTQANPSQPDARPVPRTPFFSRDAREEEAVHCGHSRGREKYIEQLESYLKNGIIDKDEYRIMRARYEKLELPDDYH